MNGAIFELFRMELSSPIFSEKFRSGYELIARTPTPPCTPIRACARFYSWKAGAVKCVFVWYAPIRLNCLLKVTPLTGICVANQQLSMFRVRGVGIQNATRVGFVS